MMAKLAIFKMMSVISRWVFKIAFKALIVLTLGTIGVAIFMRFIFQIMFGGLF